MMVLRNRLNRLKTIRQNANLTVFFGRVFTHISQWFVPHGPYAWGGLRWPCGARNTRLWPKKSPAAQCCLLVCNLGLIFDFC